MDINLTIISALGFLLLGTAISLALAAYVFLLPPKYPQSIPAIPFWVTLIPIFKDIDQSEIFSKHIEEPIRTHGAVKLFFAARWNVVVHRPQYLAQMFKHGGVYEKSGNQKKIPHSVLADFLGDNIISSHGWTWKKYRDVIKPGLQRRFEVDELARNAEKLCDLIDKARTGAAGGAVRAVFVQELLQRYTIANIGQVILQTDFGTLSRPDASIHLLQTALKQQIFKPIFMSFPILDRLPISSRQTARKTIARFKDELSSSLVRSHEKSELDSSSDKLGARLLAARESGELTEKQFRDNLTVLYVAGQENPQIGLTSTLYLLAQRPQVQQRLWEEIRRSGADGPALKSLQSMPYMTSVVYESLRVLPPISQLINRRAAEDVMLDTHIYIPKGMYMGYHCYSTHHDVDVWGPDAGSFRPERWGDTPEAIQRFYRPKRTKAEFVSFHGGNRACMGEKFAILQLRVTLFALARRFTWELDPTWPNKMTPVSRWANLIEHIEKVMLIHLPRRAHFSQEH